MAKEIGVVSRRLPTWEIRLSAWLETLKVDMRERESVNAVLESMGRFYDSIAEEDGIPEDQKTFLNWVKKKNYPKGENLTGLERASPLSAKWLKTDENKDLINYLLNSLDYYFCSLNTHIKPTLFKPAEQEKFASQCLSDIAERWRIPFISMAKKRGWGEDFDVQDISLSMLETHGNSAVPFYLCSLAAHGEITDDEVFDWYIGLSCSTLIITAKLHGAIPAESSSLSAAFSFSNHYMDKVEVLGTNPNLLHLIGNFLSLPEGNAVGAYVTSYDLDIGEISDAVKLLEHILLGNIRLRKRLDELGVSFNQIIDLFSPTRSWHSAFPRLMSNTSNRAEQFTPIRVNYSGPTILYTLFPQETDEPIRISKQFITSDGRRMEPDSLVCQFSKKKGESGYKHEDDACYAYKKRKYSWGYGGAGVYQMAYTILYDLFNKGETSERVIPNALELELIVNRLLSKVHFQVKYTISSEQLIHALQEPIHVPKELSKKSRIEFLVECQKYNKLQKERQVISA